MGVACPLVHHSISVHVLICSEVVIALMQKVRCALACRYSGREPRGMIGCGGSRKGCSLLHLWQFCIVLCNVRFSATFYKGAVHLWWPDIECVVQRSPARRTGPNQALCFRGHLERCAFNGWAHDGMYW